MYFSTHCSVSDQKQEQSFLIRLSMTHFLLWNYHIPQKYELCNFPEQTWIIFLLVYSAGVQTHCLQPRPMWLLRKETQVCACHVIHPVWEDPPVSGEEGGICQSGPLYIIARWREGAFQLVRRWWSPSNCITGLVLMLQLLTRQGWTCCFFLFSLPDVVAEEPEEQLSWREMLWIYAMLLLLLSQAWGDETSMNLNIVSFVLKFRTTTMLSFHS